MELYVCGRSPLLATSQPLPRECGNTYCSDRCKYTLPGHVCVDDPQDQGCLSIALGPTRVLSAKGVVEILSTDAQNILNVSRDDGETSCTCLWGSDGRHDIDVPLIKKLLSADQELMIQDMWFTTPHADAEDAVNNKRLPPLGMLTRDGGIFLIQQQPPRLTELTSPSHQRPVLHAAFGTEVTRGMGDTWPTLVFPEQPRTVYRLSTVDDLVAWLAGAIVMHRSITLPNKVMKLTTGGEAYGTHCLALTAAGEVYIWGRASSSGMSCRSTLQDALLRDGTGGIKYSMTTAQIPRGQFPDHPSLSSLLRLELPPISRLVAGPTIGAAVSSEGALYVFATRALHAAPHLKDVSDREYDPLIALPPFVPSLARILPGTGETGSSSFRKAADVAVGRNHIVVLTTDGRVFTAGEGTNGQLGVLYRRSSLRPGDRYGGEEARRFADEWHEVTFEGDTADHRGCRVVGVGAGWDSTLFLLR